MDWNLKTDEEFGSLKLLELKYRRGDKIIHPFCRIDSPQERAKLKTQKPWKTRKFFSEIFKSTFTIEWKRYWQNEKTAKLWILSISLTKEGLNKYIKLLCEMTWVAPSVIWPHLFLLTKKCQKSREIEVLTLNEKISLSSEQLEELQWNFQERRDLILKVTQKTRLHRLSRRYKFGTSYNYCKNLNWKKPSQDFQFFDFGYRTKFLSQFIFVVSEY